MSIAKVVVRNGSSGKMVARTSAIAASGTATRNTLAVPRVTAYTTASRVLDSNARIRFGSRNNDVTEPIVEVTPAGSSFSSEVVTAEVNSVP